MSPLGILQTLDYLIEIIIADINDDLNDGFDY